MARIRTIKPELWTDPEFVECSAMARILFVASLNFASDYGVLPDKPKQLKMQCLAGDSVDIDALIGELIEHDFYIRRHAPDGAKVLVIRTFCAHQRVDKPQPGKWGNPHEWCNPPLDVETFDADSQNIPGTIPEPSQREGKGREGKGSFLQSSDIITTPVDNSDDDEKLITLAIARYANLVAADKHNPGAYAHTITKNALTDGLREQIRIGARIHPTFDADQLADWQWCAVNGHSTRATVPAWSADLDCQVCDGTGYEPDDDTRTVHECPCRTNPKASLHAN
jgi:hypothetical protein